MIQVELVFENKRQLREAIYDLHRCYDDPYFESNCVKNIIKQLEEAREDIDRYI